MKHVREVRFITLLFNPKYPTYCFKGNQYKIIHGIYYIFLFFHVKTSKLDMSFTHDGIFQFGVAILMSVKESQNVRKLL